MQWPRWAQPLWLVALAALPLLAWWLGRGRRATGALLYSGVELAREAGRTRRWGPGAWAPALRYAVLAAMILALARPQLDRSTREVQSSGIDLALAVDVSGSMGSLDFAREGDRASRIDVVREVVARFVKGRPGDRIGIVAFAAQPFILSPPTLDQDWLARQVERLEVGLVRQDGTAIGAGIMAALNRLKDAPPHSRVVVLLTDGVNNAGKVPPETAAEAARALGVKVYTIGVGREGVFPAKIRGEDGVVHYTKIRTEIDEGVLRRVAESTGGRFYRATDADALRRVYAEIDQLEKSERRLRVRELFVDLYPWLLAAAAVLLLAEGLWLATGGRRVP